MKNEPEIVKQLRQEEECGKLISSTIHTWEKEQTDESFNNTTSGTIQLFKKDIKHDSDRFDFDSISEKYQTIFENYAVAITIADAEERIISWNKYAEEIFNMNEKDLSMAHVSNLYPPEEWKRIRKENIRKKGMKYKLETKMIRKGHDPFDVEISLSVLRGSGGKITGSVAIIKDITKYKKTEKKLVESEDKYRTIFDNSAVAIMLTDENENIVSWNKYAETLLKFDKKDLYMKPVESLYPTEEWKKIRSENVRQKGMQHHLETKILQRNKKPLDVDISISVLKNREGKIIGSIGIIKDISERKEVEEKLEYEHDLLQSLLDNVPDSIVFKNREGKFIKVNNAKAIHYDAAPEDMLGKSDFDFLERDEAEKIYEDDQRILKTGKSIVNKVEKITDKKGRTHWISVTKTPRFNKCDEIIGTMGISRDITDIKQAEEELKKSEEKYHNLFDESADLIILIDDKGKFLDVNKKFIEESGYKKEEILGKYFLSCNIVTKESEIKIKKNLEKLLSGESYPIFEIEGVKKSGKIIPYEIRAVPIEQNSKIIGIQATLRNITDRKKAQEKYERLFNTSPDLIAEIDEDGVFVAVNATMAKSIGLPVEDVVGKKIFDVLPREIAEKRAVFGRQVIKKGEIKIVDDERNGIFFNNIFVPIYNPYGKNSVQVIARDVTLQKKAEQAILNSEKRYRELFEKAIDPIIILDDKGFFVDVNEQVEKILGYKRSELIGKKFYKIGILDEKSMKISLDNFKKRMKGENVSAYEVVAIAKNNEHIPAEINANLLIENNKIIGDLVILRDLRDRYKRENVEKELIESEKKFEDIFDSTRDFLIYLENGIILDLNNAASSIIGLSKWEMIGKPFSKIKKIFTDEGNKRHMDFINNVSNGQQVKEHECEIITKDKVSLKYLFSNDLISEGENIRGVLVRGRDITQRQRAWDELVRLEEKYRVLAETSADGVLTLDPLGRLTYVNPSFEKICGRRKSQILATIFRKYLSEDSVYLFQQIFIDARKKKEKIEGVELDIVHTDGTVVPTEINIAPLNKDGEFVGLICTVRDITSRKKIEEELKKSERLKTEFMNIAAHELKSPVTPIKGYLDLIISDKDAEDKIKNWARISLRNSERLLKLVNDILDVSRLDSDTMRFDMTVINPVEILDEIVEDMKPAVENKKLEFKTEIPKELPNIMGDRYRLSQVLKNLLVNAIKFTDNGSISIKAKKEGRYIVITVEDTGIGISKDEVTKIFSKFYQAYTGDDRKNEGTGLGLFICKEILHKHNGDIWADSEIGEGSTFTMKIPYL